jgi:hypothetical protein
MSKDFFRNSEQAVALILKELGEGRNIQHNKMQAGVLFCGGAQHQQYDLAGIGKNGAGHRWDVKTFYARKAKVDGGWYFPVERYKHDGYMAYLKQRRLHEPQFGYSYVYATEGDMCPSGPGVYIADVDTLDHVKMDCLEILVGKQNKLYNTPLYNFAVTHFRKVDGIERYLYLKSQFETNA